MLQEKFVGWRQIVSRIKDFHSKAVMDATQNFPTGPVSTFLLTWPDPSPPQTAKRQLGGGGGGVLGLPNTVGDAQHVVHVQQ